MERNKVYRTFAVESNPTDGGLPILQGRAVVYGALSCDMGGWQDTFEPGCFDEYLATDHDILAYYDHNSNYILGRESNQRLQLTADSAGIGVLLNPSNTSWSQDLCTLIADGTVKGMSFGCYITESYWDTEAEPLPVQHITKAELCEVTFTGNPAMVETRAVIRRSLDEAIKERDAKLIEIEEAKAKKSLLSKIAAKSKAVKIANEFRNLKTR